MHLIESSVEEFCQKLGAGTAAPGGGSASGLSLSLGSALISMVISLTEDEEELQSKLEEVRDIRSRALELIDEDTDCFNQVMEAFRMPRDTEEEKNERSKAIQAALTEASLTPLETMKLGHKLLEIAHPVAENGNPNAVSDAGVGALLGIAAVKGGYYNVIINTKSLSDKEKAAELEAEAEEILHKSEEIAARIEGIVLGKTLG